MLRNIAKYLAFIKPFTCHDLCMSTLDVAIEAACGDFVVLNPADKDMWRREVRRRFGKVLATSGASV